MNRALDIEKLNIW